MASPVSCFQPSDTSTTPSAGLLPTLESLFTNIQGHHTLPHDLSTTSLSITWTPYRRGPENKAVLYCLATLVPSICPLSGCLCHPSNFDSSSESLIPFSTPFCHPYNIHSSSPTPACFWSSMGSGDCAKGAGVAYPSLCQPLRQVGDEDCVEGRGIWKAKQKKPSSSSIWYLKPWCQELRSLQCQGHWGRYQPGMCTEEGFLRLKGKHPIQSFSCP